MKHRHSDIDPAAESIDIAASTVKLWDLLTRVERAPA